MALVLSDFSNQNPENFRALFAANWQESNLDARLQSFGLLDLAQNPPGAGADTSRVVAADLEAQLPFRFSPQSAEKNSVIEINRALMESPQPFGAMRAFQCAQGVKQGLNSYQRLPEGREVEAFAESQCRNFYEGLENSPSYYLYAMKNPQALELQPAFEPGQRSGQSFAQVTAVDTKALGQEHAQEGQDQAAIQEKERSKQREIDQGYSISF